MNPADTRMHFWHRLQAWATIHPVRVFALFYALCAVFIVVTAQPRAAAESDPLAGDGFYYYAYARSMLIDNDVNLRNEYEEHAPPGKIILEFTDDGTLQPYSAPLPEYPDNYFAIGSGILWLPAIAVVHAGLLGLQATGIATATADGFSLPYIAGVGVLGCFYAFLATWLIYKTLCLRYSNEIALITSLFMMTTTASINYVVIDPFYNHVNGMLAASLVFYLCLRHPSFINMRLRDAFLIGAAIGLAAIVRWQIVLLGLIPFVTWVHSLWQAKQPGRVFLKGLVLALAAALVFTPQSIAWHSIYGAFLLVPQGTSFFEPRMFGWAKVLFSNDHGMFFWHPVTGVAFTGLLLSLRKRSLLPGGLQLPLTVALIIFLLEAVLNGMVSDINAGASFGMRRMINTYPVLAWGLAYLLTGWYDGTRALRVFILWIGASTWNLVLLGIWVLRIGEPVFPH